MLKKMLTTDVSRLTILIRLMVGLVFLSEGVQKFLFPAELGAGRLEKAGWPAPGFLGPFVGSFEMVCGVLVLLGLTTRYAAIPLICIMLVAIATTKIKLMTEGGMWHMLHESRTDWSMLMGSVYLLLAGGGKWSIDHYLTHRYLNKEHP